MIIDLEQFVRRERPYWNELEEKLEVLENRSLDTLDIDEVKRLHYLYRRVSSDLSQVENYIADTELKNYLEKLVSRAYVQVHQHRSESANFSLWNWCFNTFPSTFRKHIYSFLIVLAVTGTGMLFGGGAILFDTGVKEVLLPFPHLHQDPSRMVEEQEREAGEENGRLEGAKARFSVMLMRNNIRVSILALALGLTWGVGTIIVVFYNSAILGAVITDFVMAGESKFLTAWLLPHGIVELPAIFIAAQAGLVLAHTLIGYGDRTPLLDRLREVGPDLVTFIAGVALMLVWAGLVESFISQYHEPLFPYEIKILFGILEGVVLVLYFWKSGDG